MHEFVESDFRVPFDESFRVRKAATGPSHSGRDKQYKKELKQAVRALDRLQQVLYASDRYALLLIFQAMDAAGKDSTIRAVMRGINPAGCQVYSFKQPTPEELDHDFLWRTGRCLPEKGRIGIFNRSYYEEVLVVRVHPEYLQGQRLAPAGDLDQLWAERYESIREHERHLARNGTVILKFWLNVSAEEQARRFRARIDEPEKNWKFSVGDLAERARWEEYMAAYQQALRETSRPWAPWYAIPADNKPYMRARVADLIVQRLAQLDLTYPQLSREAAAELESLRDQLPSP